MVIPGGAQVRRGARFLPSKGSGDTYFIITSDSLSTGFSSGLQEERHVTALPCTVPAPAAQSLQLCEALS